MKDLDTSVFDVLAMVREKPGLYFGKASLERLNAFLHGYNMGLHTLHYQLKGSVSFGAFHDWVAQRLNFTSSTGGWCNMIVERTKSDAEAFRTFYELLDEFCRERGIPPGDPKRVAH
jgi:hypothetical protein